jgi:hypothetical protein
MNGSSLAFDARFVCVDCGQLAPPDEGSSLLTLKHGWRIRRRLDGSGMAVVEARCAPCYARLKRGSSGDLAAAPLAGPGLRFVDFARRPESIEETSYFRSSWLASSLRALRTRGYFEAYKEKLPGRFHAPVLESVAGTWLPVEVALAHYTAIDALGIPPPTIFEMGREVQDHAQSILAPLALRAAKDVGVTPWFIFGQFRKIWDRTWRGGDFAIDKMGPKEAELEIVAWTIAPSTYVRQGMRGVFDGMLGMFCQKAYVHELPANATRSLRYRFSWV